MKSPENMAQRPQSVEDFMASLPPIDQFTEFCPRYHHAMDLIGKRWMGAILRVLMHGKHRYNEILSTIPGLSDRLLTERLRELEAEGLVTRRIASTSPVRIEYELTIPGQELELAVRVLSAWTEKWLDM